MTQSDYLPSIRSRLPDSDTCQTGRATTRSPGAAHATPDELNFAATPDDIVKAQRPVPPMSCNEGPRSRFPNSLAFNAILENLQQWIRKGVPPPPSQNIAVGNNKPFLDKFGNVQRRHAITLRRRAHERVACQCDRRVVLPPRRYEVPSKRNNCASLYPTKAAYERAVEANVAELVKQRSITAADGKELVEEVKKMVWK